MILWKYRLLIRLKNQHIAIDKQFKEHTLGNGKFSGIAGLAELGIGSC